MSCKCAWCGIQTPSHEKVYLVQRINFANGHKYFSVAHTKQCAQYLLEEDMDVLTRYMNELKEQQAFEMLPIEDLPWKTEEEIN